MANRRLGRRRGRLLAGRRRPRLDCVSGRGRLAGRIRSRLSRSCGSGSGRACGRGTRRRLGRRGMRRRAARAPRRRRRLAGVSELARRTADDESVPGKRLVSARRGGRRRRDLHGSDRRAGTPLGGRPGRSPADAAAAAGRLSAEAGRCRRRGLRVGAGGRHGWTTALVGGRARLEIDAGATVGRRSGRTRPGADAGLAGAESLTVRLGGARGLAGGRFLRLHRTAQAVPVSLPSDAVGLSVLDRGGVALHADPKLKAKVERFFVRQSQLAGKLVDADLLRQLALRSSLRDAPRALQGP